MLSSAGQPMTICKPPRYIPSSHIIRLKELQTTGLKASFVETQPLLPVMSYYKSRKPFLAHFRDSPSHNTAGKLGKASFSKS